MADDPKKQATQGINATTTINPNVDTPEVLLEQRLKKIRDSIGHLPLPEQERFMEMFRTLAKIPGALNSSTIDALTKAYSKQQEDHQAVRADIPKKQLELFKQTAEANKDLQTKVTEINYAWLKNYYDNQQTVLGKYFAQATTVNDTVVGLASLGAMVGMIMQFIPGYEAKGQALMASAFKIQEEVSNKTLEQLDIMKRMNTRPTDAMINANLHADSLGHAVKGSVTTNAAELDGFVGRVSQYFSAKELTDMASRIASQGQAIGPNFFKRSDVFFKSSGAVELMPLGKDPDFDRIHAVVAKLEGGYANNGNDKGGPTIYGIASTKNPDAYAKVYELYKAGKVDEAKEYSRGFYYTNYYQPVVKPGMSAAEALVVYDTAVNMGVSVAQEWSQKWGHNVRGIIASRQQMYESIIAKDPSQAVFANGWNSRLSTLGGYVVQGEETLAAEESVKVSAGAAPTVAAQQPAKPQPAKPQAAAKPTAKSEKHADAGSLTPPANSAFAKNQPAPTAPDSRDVSRHAQLDLTAVDPKAKVGEGKKPAVNDPIHILVSNGPTRT